jgi:hypothetical protein
MDLLIERVRRRFNETLEVEVLQTTVEFVEMEP